MTEVPRSAPPHPRLAARPLPPGERLLRAEGSADRLENALEICRDVVVPEAQHTKSFTLEPRVALEIILAVGMVQTVRFKDQIALEAHEIHDEATNWLLSVELHTQLCSKQLIPQQQFGISLTLPQRPRSRCQYAHPQKLPLPSLSLGGRGRRLRRVRGAAPHRRQPNPLETERFTHG